MAKYRPVLPSLSNKFCNLGLQQPVAVDFTVGCLSYQLYPEIPQIELGLVLFQRWTGPFDTISSQRVNLYISNISLNETWKWCTRLQV